MCIWMDVVSTQLFQALVFHGNLSRWYLDQSSIWILNAMYRAEQIHFKGAAVLVFGVLQARTIKMTWISLIFLSQLQEAQSSSPLVLWVTNSSWSEKQLFLRVCQGGSVSNHSWIQNDPAARSLLGFGWLAVIVRVCVPLQMETFLTMDFIDCPFFNFPFDLSH